MMKKLTLLIGSLCACTAVSASQINEIVVLGDSLSDNGNLYSKIKILPKSPPYFHGRFTNGPTWAEYVGKHYYNKYYIDTQNYAVGGATAIQHNPIVDKFAPPITLTGEVYDYLLRSLFSNKDQILFSIWIGANDYLYNTKTSDMDETSSNVVDSIAWSISTLADRGAKYFLVMNIPDLSRTPYAKDNNLKDELHSVSVMHNTKLANALKQIQYKYPDIKIVTVDIFNTFNDLLDNPQKYNQLYNQNFTNFTKACWEGPMMIHATQEIALNKELKNAFNKKGQALSKNFDTDNIAHTILKSPALAEAYNTSKLAEDGALPCNASEQYIFWDHIHPTDSVHQVIASIVENTLESNNI